MADLTINSLSLNTVKDPTVNDGAATQTLPYVQDGKILVYVLNGDSSNAVRVKFSAGSFNNSGQGDLDMDLAASADSAVILESSRFKTTDGDIDIAITDQDNSEFTGDEADVKITVYKLP